MGWDQIRERLDALLASGKHGELRGALMMLNEVDIAEYLTTLDPEKVLLVFRILPKDISADVFAYMDSEQRQNLISSIGDSEIRTLLNEMFIDDAVDFLEEMPASVVKRILQNTDEEKRNLINRFLSYPENSAGSIMTIEYCEFHSGITVGEAMAELRRTGLDKETINTLYVIDNARHLEGTIQLRKLIMAGDDKLIESLMDSNVITVHTLDDQEQVAEVVRKYDLISVPVLDKEDRLVGIITIDDIVDVIEDEATEDIEKMGALVPSDGEYLKTSPFKLALNRIPWLLLLMVSAMFTGQIITSYETLLNSSSIGIILTACIPMMMDTGGNCGSQASTLAIRGLALGEIQLHDVLRVLWKELRVGLICGFVLAVVNYFRLIWLNGVSWAVALVVAISMYVTVIFAKALGCTLPMLAKKLKLDPALMASPLITTMVDAGSLFILFTIATNFLL